MSDQPPPYSGVPNFDTAPLEMWVLYDKPKDMPGYFVLRRFLVTKDGEVLGSAKDSWCCRDAEPLRVKMRERGLHCMVRHPSDEPHIVETWL